MASATSDSSTRAYYDAAGPAYDQWHSGPWWQAVRRWEARAIALLRPPLLDVGCGTGYWQARLAKRWQLPVIGVDPSIGMLRRNRSGQPALQASAERLPFPDASFRGVACMLTVLNSARADAALREIARVLMPGGRCAMSIASIWDNKGNPAKSHRSYGRVLRARLYRREEFEALASAAGLRCIRFDGLFRRVRMRWGPFPMTPAERAAFRAERTLPAENGRLYSFVFEKPGSLRRPARYAAGSGSAASPRGGSARAR